jgi:phosphatidylinositol alpha-mannosyltransferase
MDVLVDALDILVPQRPDVRLLVAGRGDAEDFLDGLPPAVAERIDLLGQVSEPDKARLLRSVDVYCAPNTGQESFGVILLEAMAAGTSIVASDIEAFRRVLDNGRAGLQFPVGDPAALADTLGLVLDDAELRARLVQAGRVAVAPYDWSVIVAEVLRVYELAIAGAGVIA